MNPIPTPQAARNAGQQAAMSQFGLDTQREEVDLARKLHAANKGGIIAAGLPGLNSAQQSNLRRNYQSAMDMSAHPRFRSAPITKVALERLLLHRIA